MLGPMTTRISRPMIALLGLAVGVGVALGGPVDAAHARSDERPAAPYSATLAISRSESMVDQAVKLSGQVKPVARGTVVKLQKKLEGKTTWTDEKTLTTNAAGKFSYTDKPTTAGKRQYRVVVPATAKHAKGISKPVALLLYRWLDLTTAKVRSSSATYALSTVAINGVDYSRGLVGSTGSNGGMIDWNFDRRCTSLKARFGNGDASDDTATATVELDVDGDPVYNRTFGLTESQYQVIDVTGAFRVAFQWTSSNSAGTETNQSGAQAALATPLVRCSF